jgi:peptidyl-prolyl cis-trans isomerase SurA
MYFKTELVAFAPALAGVRSWCAAMGARACSALAAALFIISAAHAQPIEIDRVFAVVDDDVVLKSEFDERWAQIEAQIQQTPAGQRPPTAEIRKQLLDQLVLEHLQMQMAERAGVRIDDNMLNRAMESIAAQNNLSFEQFRQALDAQGLYESTRAALRDQITLDELQRNAVNRRIEISRQEIENYLRSETGMQEIAPEYHVAHVLIPNKEGESATRHGELATLLYERIKNGEDIRAIAASRQVGGIEVGGGDLPWGKVETLPSMFRTVVPTMKPGEVKEPFTSQSGYHIVQLLETRGGAEQAQNQSKVRHILIKPNEIRTEAQAEALINTLYQRIKNGEDFADVARQNTDDAQSMVAGGDLDWIADGMLPPDFMEVVNNTPVGTMTPPFHVSTGWHIIEVLDRRVQDVTEESKRFQAENILRQRKFDSELQNWLAEMRDTHYIDIKEPEFKDADEEDAADTAEDAEVEAFGGSAEEEEEAADN